LQTLLAAGKMAKGQLPTSYETKFDETLATAIEKIETFPVEKTIERIDTNIDEKIVEAKIQVTSVVEQTKTTIETTKTTIDGTIVDAKKQITTSIDDAKAQITTSIDGAKTQVTETVETAKTQLNETVQTAKTQLNEKVQNAKTEVTSRVSETLTAVDQNPTVNKVVDAIEPAVRAAVEYVLPEDEEVFEDARSDDEDATTDEKSFAIKKTLRLTKSVQNRVSKTLQKRWVAASSQIEKINTRTDEVRTLIVDNGVDLIAYSKTLKGNLYDNVSTISKTIISNPTAEKIVAESKKRAEDASAFAHNQIHRLGELSTVQLDRIAPTISPYMAPTTPYIVRLSSTIGVIFGVDIDEATLRQHDWFNKIFTGNASTIAPPAAKQEIKLEDAHIDSAKEMEIRKALPEETGVESNAADDASPVAEAEEEQAVEQEASEEEYAEEEPAEN